MKENINKLLSNFNKKTKSKGSIIVDSQGLILFSDCPLKMKSDKELNKIAALLAVKSSIASKLSLNITDKEMEMSVILNDEDYIIIKLLKANNFLLTHHKRANNLDFLYEEVKVLSKELNTYFS